MKSSRITPVDLDACRARLVGGSRSFLLASRLLPAAVAESATVFYAFCRVADDVIDDFGGGAQATAWLQRRLEAMYRGSPENHPEDRALAIVIARHGIPRALLEALLEGFQWDAAGRRYADLAELEDYAARVAGSVGAVMALLVGERRPQQLARACELGVAMQLTNICRDVAEDAAIGRLYLPENAMRGAGLDPAAWLATPAPSAALGGVLEVLLARAHDLYRQAGQGVRRLPWRVRPGINAAALLYEAIGDALQAQGTNPFRCRARVPYSRQFRLLFGSLWLPPDDRQSWLRRPIPAVRHLIDVVVAEGPPPMTHQPVDRWAFLVDLFIRLDERSRSLPRDVNT
jgi:phytoene synthase